MESSDMKNMVVLKNLPSNMVEEAIIIFKETQKVKQKELIDRSNKLSLEHPKSKEYIVKEAERLVADYINKLEKNKKGDKGEKNLKMKYRRLAEYSVISTVCLIISLVINFI